MSRTTELFGIIQSLRSAKGSIAKQKILDDNQDNQLLKEFLRLTYDPAINFYIRKIPEYKTFNLGVEINHAVKSRLAPLYNRSVRGEGAKKHLVETFEILTPHGQALLRLILERSIGGNIGETMILKTWPHLFFVPPYMRCSLLDDKARQRFADVDTFIFQPKLDGAFCYLKMAENGPPEAITRAGSKYPSWVAQELAKNVSPDRPLKNVVFSGELLVKRDAKVLTRQEGNGILNAVLKGEDKNVNDVQLDYVAWDCVTSDEWQTGKSEFAYVARLADLRACISKENVVHYETCSSLKEAFGHYQKELQAGGEGGVIKTLYGTWKDGTSKDCVKLKMKFQVDLEVYDYYEGQGKAKGMLGGLRLRSSDGLLVTDCGSGYDDATRKVLWTIKEQLPGKIVTVEANDIGSNRSNDTKSLFLPIFLEVREDKIEADSLARIIEQREAAIEGVL